MHICLFVIIARGFLFVVVFFKQKTAYDMRISDWSSDVCSSDLWLRIFSVDNAVLPLRAVPTFRKTRDCRRPSRQRITPCHRPDAARHAAMHGPDRKSVGAGKRVSVRVVPGGRRSITNKRQQKIME